MKIKQFALVLGWLIASLAGTIWAQPAPPPLIATEEEVRQFFSDYAERYHRKDIDGFLSLFSLNAVENKKDGLEGIRKTYTQFFNQSLVLRCRIEEMRHEIYQNAVEVKARYVIHQAPKGGGKEREWIGHIRWVLVREGGTLKILSLEYQHEKIPR